MAVPSAYNIASRDTEDPKLTLTFAAGLNENQTPDINEASAGYNFELSARQTELSPRPPFDLEATAPNTGKITGIMQMITRAIVKTILICAGNTVYQWYGKSNSVLNGTTTSGSGVITGLSSTAGLGVGQLVTGIGIGAAPNKILSIDSTTQITVSVNSTASATVAITFTSFTSVGTVVVDALLRDTYWSLGEYLVITDVNLNNVVQKWDGTTFGALTTGLASAFYAKYSIVYLNRVWFFNITCGLATPHMILASTFENPQALNLTNRGGPTNTGGATFSTGLEPFYLLSPDLKAINGVCMWQNILVISTVDGKMFKLVGTSASTFTFVDFYVGSCSIGNESLVDIGNDAVYVRKGGNISMMSSTQNYGDVKVNDVSRWIPTTASGLPGAMSIYDETLQKVYFFIANKVLVLFKDILYSGQTDTAVNTSLSPWSVYTTQHPNSFNAQAAKYMQDPDKARYTVYWGDAYGNIFDMDGSGASGDAGAYTIDCKRTTRLIDGTVLRPFPYNETILMGKVQYRRVGTDSVLSLAFNWADEFNISNSTVKLKGATTGLNPFLWNKVGLGWGGVAYWNSGAQLAGSVSHQAFSPTGKGDGFYLTLQNVTVSPWKVDNVELF